MEGFVDNPRTLFGEELKMLISYKIKKHERKVEEEKNAKINEKKKKDA